MKGNKIIINDTVLCVISQLRKSKYKATSKPKTALIEIILYLRGLVIIDLNCLSFSTNRL